MASLAVQFVGSQATATPKRRAEVAGLSVLNPISPINWVIFIVALFITYGIISSTTPGISLGDGLARAAPWSILVYLVLGFIFWYIFALGTRKFLQKRGNPLVTNIPAIPTQTLAKGYNLSRGNV